MRSRPYRYITFIINLNLITMKELRQELEKLEKKLTNLTLAYMKLENETFDRLTNVASKTIDQLNELMDVIDYEKF